MVQDGDLINVDVTIYYKGYHGDCSETFCVGNADEEGRRLVKTTYDAWCVCGGACVVVVVVVV